MQQFTMTMKITINTLTSVSEAEVRQAMENLLEEADFGTVEVVEVNES